jgi:hypothetical protein
MKDHSIHHGATSSTYSDVAWREARLRLAGFDSETASKLARDDEVDLHAVLELIDRGCPPHLAARILAPLRSEG